MAVTLMVAGPTAYSQMCTQNERHKLVATDASESAHLGASVSISDYYIVVGAWGASNMGVTSGAGYVFRWDDGGTPQDPSDDSWLEDAKLSASDAVSGDLFGWAVSASGDHIIVGARFHSSARRSGAAYVFVRNDNGTPSDRGDDFWVEEAKLTASDAAVGDNFGVSVGISGGWAIVGAWADDDACPGSTDPDCDSGAAYLFRHEDNGTPDDSTDDSWIEAGKLTAADSAPGDLFGVSVAISGSRCVVGSWHSDDLGVDSGAAYVFRRDGGDTPNDPDDDVWVAEANLTPLDGAAQDQFGVSVSISGDKAVVGAWLDDDAGNLSGSAYVFRASDNGTPLDPWDDSWVQEAKLTASDAAPGDEFGKSVSIDGTLVVVGAFEDDDACAGEPDPNPECDSGSAYVFRHYDNGTPLNPDDDSWVETGKLIASDTAAGQFFGRVSISGDRIAIGSLDDSLGQDAGAVYVFDGAARCMDLRNVAEFQPCFTGQGGSLFAGCDLFDTDSDDDVDLADHGALVRRLTGP